MRRILLISCVLALMLVSLVPVSAQFEPQAAVGGETIHIVARGETLASIARSYGTTVQAIASANGIWNPNLIYPGQRLVIPVGGTPPPTPPPPSQTYYIVQRGDTLAKIARNFGTTIWAIAQANNIANPNVIYVGMYLVIPSGTPPPPTTIIQYYVRPGDTLASIARAYGTTWQALAAYNNISNPNRIYWGMLLNIPVYNW